MNNFRKLNNMSSRHINLFSKRIVAQDFMCDYFDYKSLTWGLDAACQKFVKKFSQESIGKVGYCQMNVFFHNTEDAALFRLRLSNWNITNG